MYIAPINIIQFQGDAKAPRQMKEGSVYNLTNKLDPTDLKYLSSDSIQDDVCDKAKEVLNHGINVASTWKKEGKGTRVHEVLRFRVAYQIQNYTIEC